MILRRDPLVSVLVFLVVPVLVLALVGGCSRESPDVDWPVYLGDPSSSQYSPLDQVNRDNVSSLEPAWSYRTGDADPDGGTQIQCNPIVVDGVLYGVSPMQDLFALDAGSGRELWRIVRGERGVSRGVVYWRGRILQAVGDRLHAVDARTGETVHAFGDGGSIDLHDGLGERALELYVGATTPGVVFEGLLIMGHRANETLPSAPGDIRAFDLRTGEVAWTFHTIPHPGELGYDTWPEGAWEETGGANAWAGLSLDAERGIVYVPTGSAAYDFYGGDRPGENLFANSLLALDARTGERRWHQQLVRHDLWDRDLPAPPNLVTLEIDGSEIDAVAQITKSGHVFVFDRVTGEPLHPLEEVSVAPSDLEGEVAWPTQVLPAKPPPFARQRLTEDNVRPWALERLKRLRPSVPFTPPSLEGTVILPGFDGGGEWGGAAADPETGRLFVNASEMPWVLTMVPTGSGALHRGHLVYASRCLSCHGVEREGDLLGVYPDLRGLDDEAYVRDVIEEGVGLMPSFADLEPDAMEALVAYLFDRDDPTTGARTGTGTGAGETSLPFVGTGYHRFVDERGDPAIEPPWGTLTRIDLANGTIDWQVTLGAGDGTENYGGPLLTQGGLVFIAATKDARFRAFDEATGELLWETALPAGGYATPASYSVDGRQYVVIAAGGGKMGTPSGDTYLAFALPR